MTRVFKWFLSAAIAILAVGSAFGLPSQRYTVPTVLEVELIPGEPLDFSRGEVKVIVKFLSKIGSNRDIRLAFFTSDGIVVTPSTKTLALMAEEDQYSFVLRLRKLVPKQVIKRDQIWVQVDYRYFPDYQKIVEHVKTNTIEYSNAGLASILVDDLKIKEKSGLEFHNSLMLRFD